MRRSSRSKIQFPSRSRQTRQKNYRLSEPIAYELEVQAAVRRLDAEANSQRSIIERALADWFAKHPLAKDLRQAAELLITRAGGAS